MTKLHYFYQIDYIDEDGCANYIDTFTSRQRNKAIEQVNILNHANQCISVNTYYVLDKYSTEDEDGETDEIVEENITGAMSLQELSAKRRKEQSAKAETTSLDFNF